jgi:hypothetical protein
MNAMRTWQAFTMECESCMTGPARHDDFPDVHLYVPSR